MTDLDLFVKLYESFGVEPTIERTDDGSYEVYLCPTESDLLEGSGESCAFFDMSKRFVSLSFYE